MGSFITKTKKRMEETMIDFYKEMKQTGFFRVSPHCRRTQGRDATAGKIKAILLAKFLQKIEEKVQFMHIAI